MQFLSPTESEEIASVPASFCGLFTLELLGKKPEWIPTGSESDNTKGK